MCDVLILSRGVFVSSVLFNVSFILLLVVRMFFCLLVGLVFLSCFLESVSKIFFGGSF